MSEKEKEPLDELRIFLEKKVAQQKCQAPGQVKKSAAQCRQESAFALKAAAIILSAAAAICVYAVFPQLKFAVQPPKPIRFGPYETDQNTDRCINNLWMLAARRASTGKAVCPASGLKYRAASGGFYCPSPERHGLRELYFMPRYGVVAKKAGK